MLGHSHHTEQSKLELVEAKYKPVRLLIQENTQLRDEIDLLQKQERIPLTLAKHQPLLGLIGLATQAVSEHGRLGLSPTNRDRKRSASRSPQQTDRF